MDFDFNPFKPPPRYSNELDLRRPEERIKDSYAEKLLAFLILAGDMVNVRSDLLDQIAVPLIYRGNHFMLSVSNNLTNDESGRRFAYDHLNSRLKFCMHNRIVYDYKVVCDETNHPPDYIDNGGLRADIYVKLVHTVSDNLTLRFENLSRAANVVLIENWRQQ